MTKPSAEEEEKHDAPTEGGGGRLTLTPRMAALALAVATLVAFAPVLGASFINYDDIDYVTSNPVVPDGLTLRGIRWAFTTNAMSNWHPLAWISHMLDVSAFGLNPTGHHATSLLIHLANTLLLARLLFEATGAPWRSLAVAMLFALHPLHVESVAWVSERKDVLCTFFWILTVIAWVRWTRQPPTQRRRRWGAYASVIVLFALALMSKPAAVTLPFALLLFDVWPLGRLRLLGIGGEPQAGAETVGLSRALLEKIPLFALAAASSVVTYVAAQSGPPGERIEANAVARTSTFDNVGNAFVSYARYIGKAIAPIDLAIVYPPHDGGWPIATLAAAAIGFAIVSIAVIRAGRRQRSRARPWLPVGWFFFVGVLVPMIGLVPLRGHVSIADRYSYVSLIGLFIVVVWGLAEVVQKAARQSKIALGAAAAVVALVYGALTSRQAAHFTDGVAVFQHAVAVTGPNAVANIQLGEALSNERRFVEAERAYRTAVAVAPYHALSHAYLGSLLTQQGRLEEATAEGELAVKLDPSCVIAHYNLGLVLLSQRKIKAATMHFEQAIAVAPKLPEGHTGLGFVLTEESRFDEAIAELKKAIEVSPRKSIQARHGLGIALARAGRLEEALVVFREAVALQPSHAIGHMHLGNALMSSNQLANTDEGIEHLGMATRLEPENALARRSLAHALVQRGRHREAIAQYQEAVRLDPTNEDLRRELAMVLGMQQPQPQ